MVYQKVKFSLQEMGSTLCKNGAEFVTDRDQLADIRVDQFLTLFYICMHSKCPIIQILKYSKLFKYFHDEKGTCYRKLICRKLLFIRAKTEISKFNVSLLVIPLKNFPGTTVDNSFENIDDKQNF